MFLKGVQKFFKMRFSLSAFAAGICLSVSIVSAEPSLTVKENLEVMKCDAPNETRRFADSSAVGHLFLQGEAAKVTFEFREATPGQPVIELQEITTPTTDRIKWMEGCTNTGGHYEIFARSGDGM